MKYCPRCNKQFTDAWVTFCSDDGTVLTESGYGQHSPSPQPGWRPPPVASPPSSEQATMWLPRDTPSPGGWIAPDERPPMRPPVWQPPPVPSYAKPPSQGLAIGSMVTGIVGLLTGLICLGPIPGIIALALGLVSLSQIKKSPERTGGKPFAMVGVITGGMSVLFFLAMILYIVVVAIVSS